MLRPVDFIPPSGSIRGAVGYPQEIREFLASDSPAAEVIIPGKSAGAVYNGLTRAAKDMNAPVCVMRRGDIIYLRRRLDT